MLSSATCPRSGLTFTDNAKHLLAFCIADSAASAAESEILDCDSAVRSEMNEEKLSPVTEFIRSYECSNCGQGFESLDRLRQHQIDCEDHEIE